MKVSISIFVFSLLESNAGLTSPLFHSLVQDVHHSSVRGCKVEDEKTNSNFEHQNSVISTTNDKSSGNVVL